MVSGRRQRHAGAVAQLREADAGRVVDGFVQALAGLVSSRRTARRRCCGRGAQQYDDGHDGEANLAARTLEPSLCTDP